MSYNVVIAGTTAYAIVQQNAAQAAFENNVQCQSIGANWLKNDAESDVPMAFLAGLPPGYETHFNRKLGTCLIALNVSNPYSSGSEDNYYWVINLLTNETVSYFHYFQSADDTTSTFIGIGDLGPNATEAQYSAEERQLMTD